MVSLFFVLGTMIEFAIVLALKRKLDWETGMALRKKQERTRQQTYGKLFANDKVCSTIEHFSPRNFGEQPRRGGKQLGFVTSVSLTEKVDIAAFALFLFSYFFFNCVYWSQARLD